MNNLRYPHFHNISVLSLNFWGLPSFLATDKELRLDALGDYLGERNYDVVCIQEMWCESDFITLEAACRHKLPFSHYFSSGVLGSGLCILSRWPILNTYFMQFSLNGYIHMIHHGDWFGGKGIALAQARIKNMIVNIYNTHLIADYTDYDYLAHRVIQALDAAQFLDFTSKNVDFSILCGDLNSSPSNVCTRLIKRLSRFEDAIHAENNHGFEAFGTNATFVNSYSSQEDIDLVSFGTRIDYILYKCRNNYRTRVTEYDLPLLARIPFVNKSYSDHEAVGANFLVYLREDADEISIYDEDNEIIAARLTSAIVRTLKEAYDICKYEKRNLKYLTTLALQLSFFLFLFILLSFMFSYPLAISYIILLFLVYLLYLAFILYYIEINAITNAIRRIVVLANNIYN
ncbi:hypothetical protein O3M35_004539 [Rhynocoris fuscipes]|uniref:sphingomyelin phosphodiesterase n=1 Tax=Rhynocoris fuscipes TaxID=488301 RepID=A0AAW1CFW7_9HEMI